MTLGVLLCCGLLLPLAVQAQRFVANLTSPGWPGTYGNHGTRHLVLTASETEQLSFNFHYLFLHQNDWISFATGGEGKQWIWSDVDCTEDPHAEFKGYKFGSTFIGLSTGNSYGNACIKTSLSNGQNSDDKTANRYFATVYAYRRCPLYRQILTQPDLYMASPLYPGNYPISDTTCEWLIAPPSDKAQRIRVRIDQIVLGSGHYLEFVAGDDTRRITAAGRYELKANSMIVRFNAKGGKPNKGYQFSYRLAGCPSSTVEGRKNAHAINESLAFYDDQVEVYFRCNDGWEFYSGRNQEAYKCDGDTWTWKPIGSKTECIRSTCSSLPSLANGRVVLTDGWNTGSEATFECDGGYQLVGHAGSLRCGDDKCWSGGEMPRCENSSILACLKPIGPSNGKWECEKEPEVDGYECTGHGSVQKLECNDGYNVNSTRDEIECHLTEWKGDARYCVPVCCDDLPSSVASVPNLRYHQSGTCFRDTIDFDCDTGYNLVGNAQIECDNTGKWQPQPSNLPVCAIVTCGRPPHPDIVSTSVSYQSIKYKSVAMYSCNDPEKFELIGAANISCGADGKWSEETAPVCVKKQCEVDELYTKAPGATVEPASAFESESESGSGSGSGWGSPKYFVDDKATVVCHDIALTITCTSTGWSQFKAPKPCVPNAFY